MSVQRVGFVLGPVLFILALLLPAPEGLSPAAWQTAGLALWMAVWWMTEAIPIPATAFLPIIVLPTLGIVDARAVSSGYANPLIYLFLGGFVLGLAMQKWNLHLRLALATLRTVGHSPRRQVAGFMLATAFLSMWVSNTATTVMMLPIAMSVISMREQGNAIVAGFAPALLLAVAYSASIGGVATLIGTPPNALLAAYLADHAGLELGFGRWMILGLPVAVVMLVFTWFWLVRVAYRLPATGEMPPSQQVQGPLTRPQRRVAVVFVITALAWIFRPLYDDIVPLSDTTIAMIAAMALFMLPSGVPGQRLMDWDTAVRLPWGVLVLFGGGLALAAAINSTGLAGWIASGLTGLSALSGWMILLAVIALIIFLTELTSNTATTATFLPLLGALAASVDQSVAQLTIGAALAASCAFMMPVATPPNAIVFGSGQLTIGQMVRAGFALNIVGMVVILLMSLWLGTHVVTPAAGG